MTELELTPQQHLMLAAGAVTATLAQIAEAEAAGKRHPAAVYTRAQNGRVYLPGGKTNDQLVGILLTLPAATAINAAALASFATPDGETLMAKVKEWQTKEAGE